MRTPESHSLRLDKYSVVSCYLVTRICQNREGNLTQATPSLLRLTPERSHRHKHNTLELEEEEGEFTRLSGSIVNRRSKQPLHS
jgi:hypothetical protein